MITFPNAKINIGLQITEKRNDGYHNLNTCFYPVLWQDALEVIESSKTQFSSTGLEIPGKPEDNLCLKAYKLLNKDYNLPPVSIHLHKAIPMGAGLGGGSSDASFTLKVLNELFNLFLDPVILEHYAAQLGSDCPFFIENKPVFASGTGNIFEPVNIELSGTYIVLVYPEIHISTAEAFAGIVPAHSEVNLKEVLQTTPKEEWKNIVFNDFEKGIFQKFLEISDIKDSLYNRGAFFSAMSGSGASVYGLFNEKPQIDNNFEGCTVWQGQL